MKYRLIFVLLFLPVISHAKLAGRPLIDSLFGKLNSAKYKDANDTNKVKLYKALSDAFSTVKCDSGVIFAKLALELAQQKRWEKGVYLSYEALANNYSLLANYSMAMEYALKSLKIAEDIKDDDATRLASYNVGVLYFYLSQFQKALDYLGTSEALAKKTGNKSGLAKVYMSTGNVYYGMKNSAKALFYDSLALKPLEELHDNANLNLDYQNMGATWIELRAYDKAREIFLRGLTEGREHDDQRLYTASLDDLASLYYTVATDTLYHAPPGGAFAQGKRANLLTAIKYYGEWNRLTLKSGENRGFQNLTAYTDALTQIGDYKKAFEIYDQYTTIKDSIFSNGNQLKMAALETKREKELKNKQIEINKLVVARDRNERILYIAGLALLVVVVAALYRNYKTQKKTNKIQEEAIQQKEMLMKEIHHRVKNNLQVISTLLELQLINIADDQAKGAITESTTRLKAISLIHHQLYQDEHITTIELSKFATDLHRQVSQVFNKPGQQITFNNEIPETTLDIDTAVPVGLMLNELMTNSYKYAFDSVSGSIGVAVQKTGDAYKLVYNDSGPGLPPGLDVKKTKSLGMKIIQGLSKQLVGSFEYSTATKSIEITFKDLAGRKMID